MHPRKGTGSLPKEDRLQSQLTLGPNSVTGLEQRLKAIEEAVRCLQHEPSDYAETVAHTSPSRLSFNDLPIDPSESLSSTEMEGSRRCEDEFYGTPPQVVSFTCEPWSKN